MVQGPMSQHQQGDRCGVCIHLPVDAGTLMVASEKEDVFRILHLVGQNQADRLQRQLPSAQVTA